MNRLKSQKKWLQIFYWKDVGRYILFENPRWNKDEEEEKCITEFLSEPIITFLLSSDTFLQVCFLYHDLHFSDWTKNSEKLRCSYQKMRGELNKKRSWLSAWGKNRHFRQFEVTLQLFLQQRFFFHFHYYLKLVLLFVDNFMWDKHYSTSNFDNLKVKCNNELKRYFEQWSFR